MPDDTPSSRAPHLRSVPSGSADDLRALKLARAREEARAAARARAAQKSAAAAIQPHPGREAPKDAASEGAAPEPKPEAKAEPKADPKAEPKPEPKAEPKPEAKAAPKPEPEPKPEPKPEPAPKPEAAAPASPPAKAEAKLPAAPEAKPPAAKEPTPPAAPQKPAPKKKAAKPAAQDAKILPPARPSRPRRRHHMVALAFFLMVLVPLGATAWYLWERAADQFVSEMGFTVRREEASTPTDLLGGLSGFSSAGSSDTDVLYEYIQSQELVRLIDEELDLRGRYSVHFEKDPILSFDPSGSIEDLVAYWRRMVQISYNPGSGMLDLRVFAFEPEEARAIANAILTQSSRVINDLSAIAREDTTRYARADLTQAQDELKAAREALTAFRSTTRIIDPTADLQGQMGLLSTLEAQLASSLIELDLLRETTREGDPRITQAQRRVEVIRARIEDERSQFGQGSGAAPAPGSADYATLVAEFERLAVDREFAEQAYIAALGAFTSARAEAERQSRYLAPYVRPTLAETPTRPQRVLLLALVALFLTLTWAISVLVYYSLRDRQ